MIKPVLKYCIPMYLLLGVYLLSIFRAPVNALAILIVLGLIVAITVLGLFLGMVLSVLIRRPRYERIFYSIGQTIAFALIVILVIRPIFSC